MVYQSRYESAAFLEPHATKNSLIYLNALFSRDINVILQKRNQTFSLILFKDKSFVKMNPELEEYLWQVRNALCKELGTDNFFEILDGTIAANRRKFLYALPELPPELILESYAGSKDRA